MPIEELVNTYLPQFSGILDRYWGRNGIHLHSEYLGAGVLLLAALGVGARQRDDRRVLVWFWIGTLVISLLWALGGNTPFYQIVYAIVPGSKFFRAPSTIFYVTTFATAMLAAFGAERLLAGELGRRAFAWSAGIALAIAAFASAGMFDNLATAVATIPQLEANIVANSADVMAGAWRSGLCLVLVAGIGLGVAERRLTPALAGWALAVVTVAKMSIRILTFGPMAKQDRYAIGVDLGGTKILAAVVDQQGRVIGKGKKSTQADKGPDGVIDRIGKAMDEALVDAKLTKRNISGIGIGAPGIVDSSRAFVIEITNIPGFRNIDVGKSLRKWHDVKVALSNDVRVAAVGEHRMGAGKGLQNLICVFVGTGIGGGIILNGKVYEGSRGSAGEVGHMVTLADGPFAVGGGIRGGIEAIASRSAIERELRAGIASGRRTVLPELIKEKDGALTSSVLAKAVAKNDPLTIDVLRRAAHYLGLHAATLINAFDPQMLIYGGGVIEGLGEWMLAPIRDVAKQYAINRNALDSVQIVEAKLGEEAGVVGAALLALD